MNSVPQTVTMSSTKESRMMKKKSGVQESAHMGKERSKIAQDHGEVDVTKLHPLSPEVIEGQATINIGTIGHVSHGKSTVVNALTGVKTGRFKSERELNRTIKLGYANAKIYKCENEQCQRPYCYRVSGSAKKNQPVCEAPGCEGYRMKLIRHVSFVDCPGHDKYMATMLSGAGVMDGALLLTAANEIFPQPQTAEHLTAVGILGLEDLIILQNKVDLVKEEVAMSQYRDITNYCQGVVASKPPVIPISAAFKLNLDVLCEYLVTKIKVPKRDFTAAPLMTIIRSFDVNKPGTGIQDIQGGILGGSIHQGVLELNQVIEIRPGTILSDKDGPRKCCPLYSRIVSLKAEQNNLQFAVPGGLIGIGTTLDPCLTRGNRLVGQVVGKVGSLPDVYRELKVKYTLLDGLLGMKSKAKETEVSKLVKGETVVLNIGSMTTRAKVALLKSGLLKLSLDSPVCTNINEKVSISRAVAGHWRLIGWGEIQAGVALDVEPCPIDIKQV